MLENITEVKAQANYEIAYSVPKELKDDFDLYVEGCVGTDGIAVLDDITEVETDAGFKGCIYLSFDKDHAYNECYLNEVAETLLNYQAGV